MKSGCAEVGKVILAVRRGRGMARAAGHRATGLDMRVQKKGGSMSIAPGLVRFYLGKTSRLECYSYLALLTPALASFRSTGNFLMDLRESTPVPASSCGK